MFFNFIILLVCISSIYSTTSEYRIKNHNINKHIQVEKDLKVIHHSIEERQQIRTLYEDKSLPFPLSSHELGQHKLRHEQNHNLGSRHSKENLRRNLDTKLSSELTPLYQGYGTHFSYVYIGSPVPQRQSVIIDTGSHYTAFPCVGCNGCGQHTDKYWDPKNSTTCNIPKCSGSPCQLSQSYSEGSSWHAYKVEDKLWVGGLSRDLIPKGDDYKVDFMFGCQTSETGLFKTQLADGIMGMSMSPDTLPVQLKTKGVVAANIFALCFRVGGGIMTLGGVDQRIHSKSGIDYAKSLHSTGWFTVNLLDIVFTNPEGKGSKLYRDSLGIDKSKLNTGKGIIVDSGTTDSYLPSSIATVFKSKFKDITGIDFTAKNFELTAAQISLLPNVVFVLEGSDGKPFDVAMPWSNYLDPVGGGKYTARVYLTEGSGAVLGANFMNGFNVIFDADSQRVGFSKSDCKFEDFMVLETGSPVMKPTKVPSNDNTIIPSNDDNACTSKLIPITECDAECDNYDSKVAYIATGHQVWGDVCQVENFPGSGEKECNIPCVGPKIVRGNPFCPDKPWTECNSACIQSRSNEVTDYKKVFTPYNNNNAKPTKEQCGKLTQNTRTCYSSLCEADEGDFFVFIDMRVRIRPSVWSYVHSEAFYGAFEKLFNVRESNIDLLNDAGSEYTFGTKLHFQLRLKNKDFKNTIKLSNAAQKIPELVWRMDFTKDLIEALNYVSAKRDNLDYSRYGWLLPSDIEVLNAMAVPIGEIRDPYEIPMDVDDDEGNFDINHFLTNSTKLDLALLGVLIMCLLIMCCLCGCYFKLRHENYLLEKDKISSGPMRELFNKFQRGLVGNNNSKGNYSELEMTDNNDDDNLSVRNIVNPELDDELDDDDLEINK